MRRLLIPAVLVLSALSLVGCSASSGVSSSDSLSSVPMQGNRAAEGAADSGVGTMTKDGAIKGGAVAADAASGRQVIKTGSISLTAKKPAEAADEVSKIVERAGGRVDDRTEQAPTGGDDGRAQLTVRIPSDKLTATLDAMKALGTVENVAISSSDVTTQSQDLTARISTLRTSVDRLLDLMTKASSAQDLITIESALSERQANLEGLEAQKRQLDDQVDLSTITVNLVSEAVARGHVPDSFLDGLGAGWNTLLAFFAGFVIVLGAVLPWLVLVGLIAAIVLAIVRLRRKRGLAKSDTGLSS